MIEESGSLAVLATTMAPAGPMVALAAAYSVVAVWYWLRLGRGSVPRSRRICRRWGIVFGTIAIGGIVVGVSIVDAKEMPIPYLASWFIVGISVLAVVITAGIDVILTTLLYRESLQRHILRDAQNLRQAIDKREDSNAE